MTLNQQAKDSLKSQFAGVTDDDLNGSTDEVAQKIANRTGQDRTAVKQTIEAVSSQQR